MMRITVNIFQRCVWSNSVERCKQLCDWNSHPLHLNTEFSVLYLSCFLISTCNIVHTWHACHHSLSEQTQQSIRFLPSWLPRGLGFKQMQALLISQNQRVCKTCRGEGGTANAVSFSFPPSHTLFIRRQKRVESSKEHHGNRHTIKSQGQKLGCFLINLIQIIPEIFFTLSPGWNFLY